MRAIFISYRRDDTEGQAGRLFTDLASEFGEDAVFMDVAGIEPGRDFRRIIDEHVASCGVLLAIIGKNWINAQDDSGRRRLDDPMDFVRLETASALKRDIPVIPVLVHGASMPRAEQLPPDLADLAFRNGVELTHARWESDVQVLIKALRPHVQVRHLDLDADEAKAGPGATQTSKTGRAASEPSVATSGPGAIRQPAITSIRVIMTALVTLIAVAFGGYAWYSKSSKAPEIAAKPEASVTLNLQVATNEPKANIQPNQMGSGESEADKLARKQVDEKTEAARLAKEKREREAKIRAKQAADKIEADRLVVKQAADKMEADRLAAKQAADDADIAQQKRDDDAKKLAAARAAAAQRVRWPSYNFPPPNGGSLVFTIMPDGNPACASYNGASCLWGLSYDQVDFGRLKPLVCGEAHRAKWGATGYEDPKHWCNLAKRVSGVHR